MIVGFYLSDILTNTHKPGVYGDEIWVNAIVKGLREQYPENKYYIFGNNLGYTPKVDVAIYFHRINKKYGNSNIYIQQNYRLDKEEEKQNVGWYQDKKHVATISGKYAKDYGWQLLYPAIDDEIYCPERFSIEHNCDIFYAGSNIKDTKTTDTLLSVPNTNYIVFGNGFGQNLSYEKLKYYYSSALLSLNIPFNAELDVITAKPFQIASCKGILVSPETPTLRRIFGDNAYLLKQQHEYQFEIIQALKDLKLNRNNIVQTKKEALYNISKEYNYKIQSKLFWEWVTKCL